MVNSPHTTTEKRNEFEQSTEPNSNNQVVMEQVTSASVSDAITTNTEYSSNQLVEEDVEGLEDLETLEELENLLKEQGLFDEDEEEEIEEVFEENTTIFTLFFSADKMAAYIRAQDYKKGKDADNRIPTEIIYELLEEKNVIYGINDGGISEYCKGKAFYKDFQVASGKRPIRGIDGSVEYFFSTEIRYAPKELSDGKVDYKELGLIRNVNAGDVLCRITPPTEGIEGTDVLGNTVKAVQGKPAVISNGKGVEVSEDGLEYIAINNGMVELNNGTVEVKEVYTVQGDVGPATGNIRFNGAVIVMGSVFSEYAIFANGDIIVNGFVEASILNSTGNILINNGINGMKKGFLKADGNVTVKFAEMARIIAGGNFYCDYCINCDVRAGDSIIGKGKRASFLGGNYIAGKNIEANTIGSGLNIPMDVQIIPGWQGIRNLKIKPEERIRENNELISQYAKELTTVRSTYDTLEHEIAKLSRKNKMDSPDEIASKKKKIMMLMQQKFGVKHELEGIEDKKRKIEAVNQCEDCMLIVRKIIHTSVKITIGSATLRINGHQERQTYMESDGSIVGYGVTPELN